jgi:hypothetical protein
MNTVIYLPRFEITTHDPYVSVEAASVAHQEPTLSRVSFNRFPHFSSYCFLPCGGEVGLHKLSHGSPQLGSSRAMPSHLRGFTSKSNKCHEDCFIKLKCSNHSQRGIFQPKLGFITNHSNLTKWCWGEITKTLG